MNTMMRLMREDGSPALPVKKAAAQHQVELMQIMNQLLADVIALQLRFEQAQSHRKANCVGACDILPKILAAVTGYVILIADHIRQLGGAAELSLLIAAAHARGNEKPIALPGQEAHFGFVASELHAFRLVTQSSFKITGDIGDDNTVALFTDIALGINNWIWFVGSNYQTDTRQFDNGEGF